MTDFENLYWTVRGKLEGKKDYKDLDANDYVTAMAGEAVKYYNVGSFRSDGYLTEKGAFYVSGFWDAIKLIVYVQSVDPVDVEAAITDWIQGH